ncbi:M56 family metallopeptidase [Gramella sp. AN32]|uniref:M56 family metallopeptidase n=1 Tax=Christiangramia antarctica TaxID=2058158 RepID=A0ABW5X8T4_9FLAO|nr:M56 family metallopeptidase [Gramella sp. AN32]MCM4155438.1 blaR1 peptidase M56 [Gramella sp. AN32]
MMTNYIIQVILFQMGFLLVFELLLKKETFFNYNRWYLLLTPIVSMLLPFLKIPQLGKTETLRNFQSIGEIWLPEVMINTKKATPIVAEIEPTYNPFLLIYAVGVLASLIFFGIKYFKLMSLAKKSKLISDRDIKIYEVENSDSAFTFFRKIFIGDQLTEEQKAQIMNHERVHIDQNHSADLFYFETLKMLFWFNPLIYIYQARLASLHEFIADENAMKKSDKKSYYEQLLNTAFGTQNISFINQFFKHSLIKKRIIMLQKNKSKTVSKFKFLMIIPLLLAMLTYVACTDDNGQIAENTLTEKVSIEGELIQFLEKMHDDGQLTPDQETKFLDLLKQSEQIVEERSSQNSSLNETVNDQSELNRNQENYAAVPFAVVEKTPFFKDCESLSPEERKACTRDKISLHVQKNFNTGLGKELGLTGLNRVIVQFKIDTNGEITDINARASREELKAEAIRVLELLPTFEPGTQNGQAVSVMYSLPITFKVGA